MKRLIISLIIIVTALGLYFVVQKQDSNYLASGEKFYKKGNFKQAIEQLTNAADSDKKSFKSHYLLGRSYESLQKLNDALKYYKKASTINPKNTEVHFNIARIEKFNNNIDNAIEHLEKAVKLQADFVGAKVMLAEAYSTDNQTKKAIKLYEELLAAKLENIDNTQIRLTLAQLYKIDNQNAKASTLIDEILKSDPNNLPAKKIKDGL